MKTAGNTSTFQGLVLSVLAADGHETGHLNLSQLDLPAPEGSQRLHKVKESMFISLQLWDQNVSRTMSATLYLVAGALMMAVETGLKGGGGRSEERLAKR